MTDAGKMYVTFWGTRGSISTPGTSTEKYGGNTPCVSVQAGDCQLIFDAGTGIRNLGLELVQQKTEGSKLDLHLLLSHTHWDHIQGLPFFAPAYLPETRLSVYGSPKKERFLESILQGQMDMDYFPVDMNSLAADIFITEIEAGNFEIGPVKVEWQEQVMHPGGSVRYRMVHAGKKIVYATDVELDKLFVTERDKPGHRALADEYIAFIRGADLLIADGQYTEKEYPTKAGFGHTSIPLLIDLAYEHEVKQLAVFHHEPQHTDSMLDAISNRYGPRYAAADPSMTIFWAREGLTLAV